MHNATPLPSVKWHHATVTRARREAQNGHKSVMLWFTGLSGAGKSTLAHAVEEKLHRMGAALLFSTGITFAMACARISASRRGIGEKISGIGEMAKLFMEAGVIALTAFISPFRDDRRKVRELAGEQDFIEIYCRCPLEVCEQRDTKGLYAKARAGELGEFTGISSPYEAPENPELALETGSESLDACVKSVIDLLVARNIIRLSENL